MKTATFIQRGAFQQQEQKGVKMLLKEKHLLSFSGLNQNQPTGTDQI